MTQEEFFNEKEHIDSQIAPNENADEISVELKLAENIKADQVLRIEGNASHEWTGVATCGHNDRLQAEAKQALEKWAKNKIFQYRHLKYIRYGHLGGSARISASGGGVFGRARSCRGSMTLKCYIEFIKQ